MALYGQRTKRWSCTERGRGALTRSPDGLTIGRSRIHWDGNALTVDIVEFGAPLPFPLRGRIQLIPTALTDVEFDLDPLGRHRWSPLAPMARVEVNMAQPPIRWSGQGYWDCNHGDEPLEQAFTDWDWSRSSRSDGTTVLYHIRHRTGGTTNLALHSNTQGELLPPPPLSPAPLPPTAIWRIPRATRADRPTAAKVLKTLEDTPFYARSVIATELFGQTVTAVHESLSLERFRQPWVQLLLPFRMPRIGG